MIDPRKQRFASYIRLLAGRMRLSDWEIGLDDGPSSEGSYADVCVVGPYRRASLRLSEEFLDAPPDVQRQILAHELVHLVTARVLNFADDEIEGQPYRDFVRCYEHGVEELALIIAPHLPLPDADEPDTDEDEECSQPATKPSASRSIADIFLRPFSRARGSARRPPACRSRSASTASGASGAARSRRPSASTR